MKNNMPGTVQTSILSAALVAACLAGALTGCGKRACFDSAGSTTTTVRHVSGFNEIHAYDNVNIVLTQDTVESVTIQAGSNLEPYITTDLDSNVLTFHNNTGCSWLKGPSENITAYVKVKTLNRILLYGSGSITSTNTISTPNFTLDAYQAASDVTMDIVASIASFYIRDEDAVYNLSGFIGYATVYCGQKGTMDLRNMQILNANVDQRSIRNMYIWASDGLTIKVEYKGNVYYKGSPNPINVQYFDDGRLLPLQ
jgi:hypothetical protein